MSRHPLAISRSLELTFSSCPSSTDPELLAWYEQELQLVAGISNLRMVHLPTNFHKVQLLFPATCANHLLHFAAQHDGSVCCED